MNTPRTDAFEKQRIVEATTNDIATEEWADFARQLERENERLREALLTIHRVLTKDGVCFHCDAGDDVICAEAFDSVKQALAAQPEEAK